MNDIHIIINFNATLEMEGQIQFLYLLTICKHKIIETDIT
jgi:hypothetical protein